MFEKIQTIKILDICDRLRLQYRNLGSGTYGILEDGKLTGGRRVNINGNYVTDFSGKGRSNGPPFVFVKQCLNLTNSETYQWFKTHFNIENDNRTYHNRGSPKQKKYKVVEPYTRKWLNE